MPNFVQLYKSTDLNAPTLSGTAGSLITLLNRVLVDGYTTASVTSITRSGATATVTVASPNISLSTGQYFTISGAVETEYNGTFQITAINSTSFSYTVTGTPTTPATGTILYAKAGLQWTRPFAAGTNAQTYRSADVTSNQFYLQVIDQGGTAGGAREAQVYGAEVMTGNQAGVTGPFPTFVQYPSGMCWRKSDAIDANVRPWAIIGDDKTFYLQTIPSGSVGNTSQLYGFGFFHTFKSGDAYNTFISGGTAFNTANTIGGVIMSQPPTSLGTATGAMYIARPFNQVLGAVSGSVCGFGGSIIGGATCINYPNGPDSGFYVNPVFVGEPTNGASLRGRLPGMYNPLHTVPLVNFDLATGVVGLSGITLTAIAGASNGTLGLGMFDTFGPWS